MKPGDFLKNFMVGDVVSDVIDTDSQDLVIVFASGYRLICESTHWKWERIPDPDEEPPRPGEKTLFGV